MRTTRSFLIGAAVAAFLCTAVLPGTAAAQRRDYMTEAEIEIIREAQDIDERILVLTRMIDRRFHVLSINVNGWKDVAKPSDVWGDLPAGTRIQLFNDVKRLLQKAVDDIDNLAANPSAAPVRDKDDRRAKKDPERFPKAVRMLASAAERYLMPLKTALDASNDEVEKGSLIDAIDLCQQIMAAVGKLPPEVKK